MVNFPSLLVSEEEAVDGAQDPGGESTVHSWINADFVPSWLRPFTLDQNTRFTRTPDHLLRPPEEPQPMPTFGIGGASWHFLEMPIDPEEEKVPLPGVKADLAALETALADLPALRAARESAPHDLLPDHEQGGMAPFQAEARGWSVDENGVETTVRFEPSAVPEEAPMAWQAADTGVPGIPDDQPSLPAWEQPQPTEASGNAEWSAPWSAPWNESQREQGTPGAAVGSVEPIIVETHIAEVPTETWGGVFSSPVVSDPVFSGAVGPSPVAPGGAEAAHWAEGADMAMGPAAPFETAAAVVSEELSPAPVPSAGWAEGVASEPVAFASAAVAMEPMDAMAWAVPSAPETLPQVEIEPEQGVVPSADAVPVMEPLPIEPASVGIEAAAAPVPLTTGEMGAVAQEADAGMAAGMAEPLPAADCHGAEGAVLGSSMADAGEAVAFPLGDGPAMTGEIWAPESTVSADAVIFDPALEVPAGREIAAVVDDEFAGSMMGHDGSEQQGLMLAGDLSVDVSSDVLAADAAGDVLEQPARVLSGEHLDEGLAAVAPLDDALLRLASEALDAAEARLESAALAASGEDGAMAPAHLVPLTRLIVVGHLALPAVGEQDLLPSERQPEVEPQAPLITAQFSWQPYYQGLRANLFDAVETPAEDATSAEESATSEVAVDMEPEASEAPVAGLPVPVSAAAPGYDLPPIDLLREPPEVEPDFEMSEEFLDQSSSMLQQILRDFGIRGEVIDANPGPVVTLYEFEPARGVKSSRVIGLAPDIARSMSAVSARVAVVEGRNVIGIELPNRRRETVWLRELMDSHEFAEARTKLGICLGKTIGGEPVIADLARMPHLLVAGTTGSGKSVAINTMILSLLYRHTPEACRLIMIDPKMLELSIYEGIPHLLTPVVTDPKKAIIALKWAVKEMEDRYHKMARLAVRNIDGYNARMAEAREKGEVITRQVQVGFDKESGEVLYEEQEMDLSALPYIVIIVDEMADLMMVAGKEIEGAIQRLAQMARAAGIHLVMATQRPSVDVITGTIKANFPTRISFQVTSKIDSRTILGEMGAETLLGQGDMLFMAGGGRITRVHGPFVSDPEVEHVVAFLKAQGGPDYLDEVVLDEDAEGAAGADEAVFDKGELGESGGDLYDQAVALVLRDRKASTSYIQRRLQVGYNKAASLMERMENEGIVGPANHAGKREILSFSRPE